MTAGMALPSHTPLVSASAAAWLAATIAGTVVLTTATLAGMVVLARRPAWWPALTAATVVSALAALLSLVPLLWGLRRSLNAAVAGYFIAMGVRAVVSLGGCSVAVWLGGYPKTPTFLLMVVYYFAVLGVESAWVARAMRTAA